MFCYLDRTYCNTDSNRCKMVKCSRHLETEDDHFKLEKNQQGFPIAISDFSDSCSEYKRGKECA